jgi:hypothetical protein
MNEKIMAVKNGAAKVLACLIMGIVILVATAVGVKVLLDAQSKSGVIKSTPAAELTPTPKSAKRKED